MVFTPLLPTLVLLVGTTSDTAAAFSVCGGIRRRAATAKPTSINTSPAIVRPFLLLAEKEKEQPGNGRGLQQLDDEQPVEQRQREWELAARSLAAVFLLFDLGCLQIVPDFPYIAPGMEYIYMSREAYVHCVSEICGSYAILKLYELFRYCSGEGWGTAAKKITRELIGLVAIACFLGNINDWVAEVALNAPTMMSGSQVLMVAEIVADWPKEDADFAIGLAIGVVDWLKGNADVAIGLATIWTLYMNWLRNVAYVLALERPYLYFGEVFLLSPLLLPGSSFIGIPAYFSTYFFLIAIIPPLLDLGRTGYRGFLWFFLAFVPNVVFRAYLEPPSVTLVFYIFVKLNEKVEELEEQKKERS